MMFEETNITQKCLLFLLLINIILGIPIGNELGITYIDYDNFFKDLFSLDWGWFWWGTNIVLILGIYLFKTND